MASLRTVALTTFTCLATLSQAQTAVPQVHDDWIAPTWPDGSTNITKGDDYTINWKPTLARWFPGYAPSANTTNVTLWVTGTFQQQYSQIVAQFVNIADPPIQWKVNLPDEELAATSNWTFRFLPANVTAFTGSSGQQVSSPQLVINGNAPTTTTSRTTAPARTGPPTASTNAATPAATPTPIPQPSGGLSGGAVAGVAIGAAVIAFGLAGLVFWFWRRKRRQQKAATLAAAAPPYDDSQAQHGQPGYHDEHKPDPYPYASPHYSQSHIHSSAPGTPGLTGPAGYMPEMHGTPGDGGHTFYAPPVPSLGEKKHSDPVPPYAASELPGSRPQSPSEMHGGGMSPTEVHGESSVRNSSQTQRTGDGRFSQGTLRRTSANTTATLGTIGSPPMSPRLQSPMGTRFEEQDLLSEDERAAEAEAPREEAGK